MWMPTSLKRCLESWLKQTNNTWVHTTQQHLFSCLARGQNRANHTRKHLPHEFRSLLADTRTSAAPMKRFFAERHTYERHSWLQPEIFHLRDERQFIGESRFVVLNRRDSGECCCRVFVLSKIGSRTEWNHWMEGGEMGKFGDGMGLSF